jgi:putative nucleotidyltransferase with HDIG domain
MVEGDKMQRDKAFEIIKEKLESENLINHSLAVEAVMRGLARKLSADEELWGLAGLLHDVDYEITADEPERHALLAKEMLAEYALPDELIHAIMAHNEENGTELETEFDRALYCADPITGLITACALVKPSKKLEDVAVKSVKKKFKDKAFARGANREQIDTCVNIGLERGEFIEIALTAMQGISGEIGL